MAGFLFGCGESRSSPATIAAPSQLPDDALVASASVSATVPGRPQLTDEELAAALADPEALLTLEMYEALLVRIAPCELDDSNVDWPKVRNCPAFERFEKESSRSTGDEGKLLPMGTSARSHMQRIAMQHLAHPSSAVRFVAAKELFGLFPWDAVPPPVMQAIRSEKSPAIRQALLTPLAMTSSSRKSDDCAAIAEVAEKSLDEGSPRTRRFAVQILGGRCVANAGASREMKVATLAKTDPDAAVRREAFLALGAYETTSSFEVLAECLRSKPVKAGCIGGMNRRWTDKLQDPTNPSEEAMRLSIDALTTLGSSGSHTELEVDGDDTGNIMPGDWPPAMKQLLPRLETALSSVVLQASLPLVVRQNAAFSLSRLNHEQRSLLPKLRAAKATDKHAEDVATYIERSLDVR